ncbi:MAG TPA: family 10 glycosylhydrolase [Thermoguttaceae bacterium]|nr:family 10 glycosylhydrolase [Thermoguttaceae bacterium]
MTRNTRFRRTDVRVTSKLILLCVSALIALPAVSRASEANPSINLDQLRAQRSELAHRQRRLLFDNDGNEPVKLCKEPTREELLSHRTTPLADTQVDTVFYCTWCSGFSMFTHATKIGQVFTSKANPKDPRNTTGGFSKNLMDEFLAKGIDPLTVMVDWAHQHDREMFWSFRMNDTHDGASQWYSPPLIPELKKQHPEWLVGSPKKRPKRGRWSAVDYGHKEIRDLAFRYTQEVCQNYDVDGIHLDFCRHFVYFKGPAWGRDANDKEREQMTSLIRRIRAMTEREGLRRGRPILLSIRVPDSVGYARAMGLDVEQWMREGLIDMMALSCYFRLNPWKVSVDLGHKYGVAVYPCLSECRMREPEALKIRSSLPAYRGRAMTAWAAGADGILIFNMFDPKNPMLKELGSPDSMKRLDKVYTTGVRDVRDAESWLVGGLRFLNRLVVSPHRPLTLQPGKPSDVTLEIGDDMRQLEREGALPTVQLRIRPKTELDPTRWSIRWEGKPLATGRRVQNWIEYSIDPRLVRRGPNRLSLVVNPENDQPTQLDDLIVWVRFPKSPTPDP